MEESIKMSPEEFAQDYMGDDPHRLMVCHMAKSEIEELDNMQGGETTIDPETGLREYSRLAPLFDDPHSLLLSMEAMEKEEENPEELPLLHALGQSDKKDFHPVEGDENPVAEEVADDGRNGDTELVMLPVNMMHFMGELKGYLSINPDGLFEFNLFKKACRLVSKVVKAPVQLLSKGLQAVGVKKNHANEILRFMGTAAGFMYGGPMGAGIGNAYASYGTGKSWKDSGRSGLKNFGGTWLYQNAPTILSKGSQMIPGMQSFGQMGSFMGARNTSAGTPQQGGNSPFSFLSNLMPGLGGSGGSGPVGVISSGGQNVRGGSSGGGSGGGDFLSGLLQTGLQLAPHVLNYFSARKAEKENQKRWEQYQQEEERERQRSGMYDKWQTPTPDKLVRNPLHEKRTRHDVERGIFKGPSFISPEHLAHYQGLADQIPSDQLFAGYRAQGGRSQTAINSDVQRGVSKLVEGPGKGQEDKIFTHIPHGSYVLDATTVANLGDGSSTAGSQVLDEYFHKQKKKSGGRIGEAQPQGMVPVYLSDKEYVVKPEDVDHMGGGSNDDGAYVLKGLVKELRKHKNSNGDRLPPRAKSIASYIRMSGRQ